MINPFWCERYYEVIMAKILTLVILAKVVLSIGQESHLFNEESGNQQPVEENPNYSYGYGVADTVTGDIKTVWEAKDGDAVKGHYSVIEPDGSIRTVEYSAGPQTGFTAVVNHDNPLQQQQNHDKNSMVDKALRDYDRYYDFSDEDESEVSYKITDRKRKRHPYDSSFDDYNVMKRQKYPTDLEASEYTHSFSIKHPHDDLMSEGTSHSHIGFKFDPNCKTKHKKQKHSYSNTDTADIDFRKHKYPSLTSSESYDSDYDKYVGDASNMEMKKIVHRYKHNNEQFKHSKPDDYKDWSPIKHGYPSMSDIPPLENPYADYDHPRPKKKYKPLKKPDHYEAEDLDDYILVPKKKFKKPPRIIDPEYQTGFDNDYEETYDDDRFHKPIRSTNQNEVVRKIVKKQPAINILDIFDI